ncbi:MAG: hypothetical protein ACXVAX_06185 [Pseudobdellovibrio sp.]
MQIENNIKPVSPIFLRNDSAQFNQKRETFHDILQRALNPISGSRPPKIELTGVLVPCSKFTQRQRCEFKLETDSDDYFLRMCDSQTKIAEKMEWDEVTVKGFLDNEENLIEVEKISLVQDSEPVRLHTSLVDSNFEIDDYRRTIEQRGKLDLAPEYLAS